MKKITVQFTFDDKWDAYIPDDNKKVESVLYSNYDYSYKIIDNKLEELKAKLKELAESELDDDRETIHILTDIQLNELLIM